VKKHLICPNCGAAVQHYRNPLPTVDVIIRLDRKIVLIKRTNEPIGWALPGGFVDYGESLEEAIIRETAEETGLKLQNLEQFRAYSDPMRDPRQHNISFVFSADGFGSLKPGDDASHTELFSLNELPSPLCFDHGQILADYIKSLQID
jgi:8-oxo-dGTP diphosphatase